LPGAARFVWQTNDIEAEDVLDAGGDRVVAVLRETGQGKGSGVALTNRWGVVMTVPSGKIVHTMVYRTPEEALEAAGRQE
jgi:ketosteroid isomerase-like protein